MQIKDRDKQELQKNYPEVVIHTDMSRDRKMLQKLKSVFQMRKSLIGGNKRFCKLVKQTPEPPAAV